MVCGGDTLSIQVSLSAQPLLFDKSILALYKRGLRLSPCCSPSCFCHCQQGTYFIFLSFLPFFLLPSPSLSRDRVSQAGLKFNIKLRMRMNLNF